MISELCPTAARIVPHEESCRESIVGSSAASAMEAIAKYDFNATADDELSFRRGETLKVGPSCFRAAVSQ
ncbi:hypothetical protein SRHO_G00335310 [Serrasalmus rhombeus]